MSRDGTISARTAPPPGPLVHLSQISGPVRSFFSNFYLFSGCFVACRGAVGGSGVGWEASGWRFGLSRRAKADSRGYCRCCGCLVGRCPCGEAVGEDVSAGRLEVLGPGRLAAGFLGLGSFDPEGLFEVVSDGQG